ncbi:MAG: hypothetical protein M3P30_03900 [Chloroflexota bacterium]|nr:hypothetical protein [Chloroflexota bacterium]
MPTTPDRSRLLRWVAAAGILGAAAVVATILIIRAIPSEGVAQVEIAGWRVPIGVVVSTDTAKSKLPGLVVGSLLGDRPSIQVDGGLVQKIDNNSVTIKSFAGGRTTTYAISDKTRRADVRNPLLQTSPVPGDNVAVVTAPGGNDAVLLLTGVTKAP